MVATTPSHGWPYPTLTDPADAFAAFQAALLGVEATIDAAGVQAYTPSWTADTSAPSNLLTNIGRYRLSGGYCTVSVFMTFGASTSGGTGPLHVSLPLPATGLVIEQLLTCKLYLPNGGEFPGVCLVGSGSSVCTPHFPASATDVRINSWQSADASAAVGTGRPLISGQFSVQNGGNFTMSGRYLTA